MPLCVSVGTGFSCSANELGVCMDRLTLSEDAKAILLLCGIFGDSKSNVDKPLSLSEYNRLVVWLTKQKYRPADMMTGAALDALKEENPSDIDQSRCERLLARGAAMAFALERWTNKGVWVVCRSDTDYPRRLREHLKIQAPPILYGIGEKRLLDDGGLAVVGSRNVDHYGSDFAIEVSKNAAMQGICIISGGARGIDQIAMGAALAKGGTAVGVMVDSLLKTSLLQEVREAIRDQRLTLVSPYYPEAGWNVGNAMGRNKHIYALSDYALVVIADYQKGGTWEGAVEELRRDNHVPVFVRLHNNVPKGNQELIKIGGLPFPEQPWEKPLSELLTEAARSACAAAAAIQQDLFTITKQGTVPVVSEPMRGDREVAETCLCKSLPKASARTNFEDISLILQNALKQPRTVADLSAESGVQKSKLNQWIKEAIKRGLIEKLTKPIRYVAVPSVEQNSLFRREDVNGTN